MSFGKRRHSQNDYSGGLFEYPNNYILLKMNYINYLILSIFFFTSMNAQTQNPSPMVELSRTHDRVKLEEVSGQKYTIENLLEKPIEIYFPKQYLNHDSLSILIHFHGSSYVPIYAVENSNKPFILATINLGHGSSAYEIPFKNSDSFSQVIATISDSMNIEFRGIYLTSFSAGYGAVRAILNNPNQFENIDGVILLDGLHTDYIPEKLTLAEGGQLNTVKLNCFLEFSKQAMNGEKAFIITHSEIFPGTYASTTETANYLINETGLERESVLKWGVLGMQLTSEVINGNFIVFGFAGNSAPDHIDHFHALFYLLKYFY